MPNKPSEEFVEKFVLVKRRLDGSWVFFRFLYYLVTKGNYGSRAGSVIDKELALKKSELEIANKIKESQDRGFYRRWLKSSKRFEKFLDPNFQVK